MSNFQERIAAELGFSLPKPEEAKRVCRHCNKREPENPTAEQKLKVCSRCRDALYCSRECQSADWKQRHKFQCPIEALGTNTYLDTVPTQEEAMNRLIDAYRLRVEDDCMYRGECHGLYGEPRNPVLDFRSFLNLAQNKTGVLPKWWNAEKRRICEERAVDKTKWSCIHYTVEKPDIQEHYNDNMMPMTLRMLAEQVYGHGME